MLFTAWGVAGLLGGRIGGLLFDKYQNYQMAFYTAAVLAAVALLCELASQTPGRAGRRADGKEGAARQPKKVREAALQALRQSLGARYQRRS